ncbi:MAG: O-methyltransferase [Proteobacteria bacterium]|nr:O-methyltransferase [Pseudomonadota bacterium]
MGKMLENPREAFRLLTEPRDALLLELEEQARQEDIPIAGPVVGGLLSLLSRAIRAKRVLELGTAMGYSGIFLARACSGEAACLTTVEADPDIAARARENFARAGVEDRVDVMEGQALEILSTLSGPYDLVFLDIDKQGYAPTLPAIHRLLRVGGLLVADNTAFAEAKTFNRDLLAHPGFTSIQLYAFLPDHSPEDDGIALAAKKA